MKRASGKLTRLNKEGLQKMLRKKAAEGRSLVETKAVIEHEDVHLAQVLNYLKAYKLEG